MHSNRVVEAIGDYNWAQREINNHRSPMKSTNLFMYLVNKRKILNNETLIAVNHESKSKDPFKLFQKHLPGLPWKTLTH